MAKASPGRPWARVHARGFPDAREAQRFCPNGSGGHPSGSGGRGELESEVAEWLFGHQYAQELRDPEKRSTEWVARLPSVVAAANSEVTRLIAWKPEDAIELASVAVPRRGAPRSGRAEAFVRRSCALLVPVG
ncbi:hypothetical protein QZH41_002577 [Actinostola sp. cb2023]|nr:hypothetical protein QZH41_002577 [Actinostola sp. cb2023]